MTTTARSLDPSAYTIEEKKIATNQIKNLEAYLRVLQTEWPSEGCQPESLADQGEKGKYYYKLTSGKEKYLLQITHKGIYHY